MITCSIQTSNSRYQRNRLRVVTSTAGSKIIKVLTTGVNFSAASKPPIKLHCEQIYSESQLGTRNDNGTQRRPLPSKHPADSGAPPRPPAPTPTFAKLLARAVGQTAPSRWLTAVARRHREWCCRCSKREPKTVKNWSVSRHRWSSRDGRRPVRPADEGVDAVGCVPINLGTRRSRTICVSHTESGSGFDGGARRGGAGGAVDQLAEVLVLVICFLASSRTSSAGPTVVTQHALFNQIPRSRRARARSSLLFK